MFTLRFTNRERYARAVRHIRDHPERYSIIDRGRDYDADLVDPLYGCGWYVSYIRADFQSLMESLTLVGTSIGSIIRKIADVLNEMGEAT